MNEQAQQGRTFVLRLFVSIVLLSLFTMGFYQDAVEAVPENKLTKPLIRLLLSLVFMYFILQGKRWAILMFSAFMAIAVVINLVALFSTPGGYPKIPFLVMVLIYGIALNYLNRSSNFKEYVKYKNS